MAQTQGYAPRVAVFIDGANLMISLRNILEGQKIDWNKFKNYLNSFGYVVGVYIYFVKGILPKDASDDAKQKLQGWEGFVQYLKRLGWLNVYVKDAEAVYAAGELVNFKGNCDVEIATDIALLVAECRVDEIVLVSGDRDFNYLLNKLRQTPYCMRATVLGVTGSVASSLIQSCHQFIPLQQIFPQIKLQTVKRTKTAVFGGTLPPATDE